MRIEKCHVFHLHLARCYTLRTLTRLEYNVLSSDMHEKGMNFCRSLSRKIYLRDINQIANTGFIA